MSKNKITIVAHSSGFHADDIFAVATLFLVFEKDFDIEVIRTRDTSIIEKADYVVDVGGVYDESKNRFDHHQQGGAGKRDNSIPYASFGLVWKRFGEELCGSLEVAEKIDQTLIQPIDANDNGFQFLETKVPGLHSLDIMFITFLYYPTWKEDASKIDEIFLERVLFAKSLLSRAITVNKDRVESQKIVLEFYNNSSDKRLIVIENSRYSWETVLSKFPEPLFVVYKNITDETWSIKGIRNDVFTYQTRKKLPESWAGKSGEELEKITGVLGSVFCHNGRFMAVAKTKEAILKLAELALKD